MAKFAATPQVGPKDGTCIVPAAFSGTVRKMDQATAIHIAVLDSDSGQTLEEIAGTTRARGWTAIIHSTHSHLTAQSVVAARPADKWLADHPGQGIADYLATKNGLLPHVVAGARIVDEKQDGKARNLIVEHAPCEKYRVILSLNRPWRAAGYPSQQVACDAWRDRLTEQSSFD